MRESVRLYRPGEGDFDWESGTDAPDSETPLYAGMARVKPAARSGEEVNAGEVNTTLREYTVSVPWSTPAPERPIPGDVFDVQSSPDARLAGLRLW